MHVLVTGATGYVGGRLVPRLLARGHRVRVLARDPARVGGRPWSDAVEIVRGDVLEPETLGPALDGIEGAYWLVHAMYGGRGYAERDRLAARHFVEAGRDLRRVVYLGGLQPDEGASLHLSSRAEVGAILAAGAPTLELRAGPVIGSGSASFEMLRYLTERLPVMTAPRWVDTPIRPIGVRDVLAYLVAAMEIEETGVVEIGSEPTTFRGLMETYAAVRGLRRPQILRLPVLTPHLAAMWVGLVTPIPNTIAVPLIEGMTRPLVGDTTRARALFPGIVPMSCAEAIGLALQRVEAGEVETRWSGALHGGVTHAFTDREGLIRDVRTAHVDAPPERVFASFAGLGGGRGWPAWDFAWGLRGALDRLLGGPGLQRGRRHPTELYPGEALDFWRVERLEPGRALRLRAEMRVPGRAWLQFEALPEGATGSRLVQTALFEPVGLAGALYWYGLYPVHARIFRGMVEALKGAAEAPA